MSNFAEQEKTFKGSAKSTFLFLPKKKKVKKKASLAFDSWVLKWILRKQLKEVLNEQVKECQWIPSSGKTELEVLQNMITLREALQRFWFPFKYYVPYSINQHAITSM